MKKFYSLLTAVAMCAAANAQTQVKPQFDNVKKVSAFSLKDTPKLSSMKLQGNVDKQRRAKQKLPTPTVATPIFDQPAGKLHSETYRMSYGFYSDVY